MPKTWSSTLVKYELTNDMDKNRVISMIEIIYAIKPSSAIPIVISIISLLIAYQSFRQIRLNRVEDNKNKVYEKILDVYYLSEINIRLLNKADSQVKHLLKDDIINFEEERIEAIRIKKSAQDVIKKTRELKVSNSRKVSSIYSSYYFQVSELLVATKVLNETILNGRKSLEVHIENQYRITQAE